MNCAVCLNHLTKIEIDPGLNALQCEEHGIWIPTLNYWKWLTTQNVSYPPQINEGEFEAGESDMKSGKVCSDCGQLLYRYGIGYGIQFHIDQCSKCAAIWLDNGEWEILKEKNLHNALHFMFSEPWQAKVKAEKEQAGFESLFIAKMGEELFADVKAFKYMMRESGNESLILTYLHNDRD